MAFRTFCTKDHKMHTFSPLKRQHARLFLLLSYLLFLEKFFADSNAFLNHQYCLFLLSDVFSLICIAQSLIRQCDNFLVIIYIQFNRAVV